MNSEDSFFSRLFVFFNLFEANHKKLSQPWKEKKTNLMFFVPKGRGVDMVVLQLHDINFVMPFPFEVEMNDISWMV